MFWLTAALLTLAASLAVLLPVVRRPAAVQDEAFDLEVYRDQLSELDRDTAQGVIAPGEAQEAKSEIARRILRAADASDRGVAAGARDWLTRFVATAAVLAVPLVGWGGYSLLGSLELPSQPLAARVSSDSADSPLEELVAQAERHLAANPEDGRGWDVLAPIYLRQGRAQDAAQAYANALRLAGESAARRAGLGEALASAAGGLVTEEARAAFSRALDLDPADPKSRYYLAMALAQANQLEQAAAGWSQLLASLPQDSPWREPTQAAMAEAERQMAVLENAQGAAPASVPREVETALAEAGPEQRQAMIEGMVASLDQKLRANPQDAEGWMRLVRSYIVLGRQEAARDALARGVAAMGDKSDGGRKLAEFAAGQGLATLE